MKVWQSISNILKLHVTFNLEIIQTNLPYENVMEFHKYL